MVEAGTRVAAGAEEVVSVEAEVLEAVVALVEVLAEVVTSVVEAREEAGRWLIRR